MSKKDSITYLDDIKDTDISENNLEIEEKLSTSEDYRKASIDLFNSLEKRLIYLKKYYELEKDSIGELISCIIGMYFFSRTVMLKEYITEICQFVDIPIIYRIDCAKSLENGYCYVNKMFLEEEKEMIKLPTPIRVDAVFFLMDSEEFIEETREYFCKIISDMTIDDLYRYKTIQRLETKFKDNKEKFVYYAKESSKRFLRNKRNSYIYRVLAGQYLLEKCEPDVEIVDMIEEFLLQVAENVNIDEDIRADACDILLQYGREHAKLSARNFLFILGGGNNSRNNIFKNAQNVHVRSIEESVLKIIEKLSIYYPHNGAKNYDFNSARDEILNKMKEKQDEQIRKLEEKHKQEMKELEEKQEIYKQTIEGALTRISIDRAVYGKTNMNLMSILSKVWTYTQDSEFKEELEKRVFEELTEAYNKCSTGYEGRLANVFTGFTDDMNVTISFEDQVIAYLETRLNSKIMEIEDKDEMGVIFEEMTIPTSHFNLRTNFLRFFRENISEIRESMYQEFCSYMTDTDYDMYFRKAIMHYEGVH